MMGVRWHGGPPIRGAPWTRRQSAFRGALGGANPTAPGAGAGTGSFLFDEHPATPQRFMVTVGQISQLLNMLISSGQLTVDFVARDAALLPTDEAIEAGLGYTPLPDTTQFVVGPGLEGGGVVEDGRVEFAFSSEGMHEAGTISAFPITVNSYGQITGAATPGSIPITVGCCADSIPRTLYATLAGGFCTEFNGLTWTLTYQDSGGDAGMWTGTRTNSGHTLILKVHCDDTGLGAFAWFLDWDCDAATTSATDLATTSAACDPLALQWTGVVIATCCAVAVGVTITITE